MEITFNSYSLVLLMRVGSNLIQFLIILPISMCQPGLPPCLGHDLFEGIVFSDLALYIQHLVTEGKHFTFSGFELTHYSI